MSENLQEINIKTIKESIKNSCNDENIEMLQYLLNYGVKHKKFIYKKNPFNYAFLLECLCLFKEISIHNWVINTNYLEAKDFKDLNMLKTVSNILFSMNKMNEVQFLCDTVIYRENEPIMICMLIIRACKYFHFEFAKKMYMDYKEQNTELANDTRNTNNNITTLNELLYNNFYDIVMSIANSYSDNILFGNWLISCIPKIKSNKELLYNGFKASLYNLSQFKNAKWFHSLLEDSDFETFITQNNCNDYNNLFQLACKDCFIERAKWLHSLKKSYWLLDYYQPFISTCLDFIGCWNNENYENTMKIIEICKWLIELDPTIDISNYEDHFIFKKYINVFNSEKNIRKKENLKMMMDWIVSLKPYDYYFDKNENSYKIRSKKDAKWEERRIYHSLALQPIHGCILSKLPYQVSAYVISFI